MTTIIHIQKRKEKRYHKGKKRFIIKLKKFSVRIVRFFHRASPSINHFVAAKSLNIFSVSVVAVPFSRLHFSQKPMLDSLSPSLSHSHTQSPHCHIPISLSAIRYTNTQTNRIAHFHRLNPSFQFTIEYKP